jgi:molybdopterin synthase catalytic subunit
MITKSPIDLNALIAAVAAPGHGGQASFVGVVRDEHEGKRVESVTYEAFEPLAEKVLNEIVAQAGANHGAKVVAAHRVGRLKVGEASVAIVAASPHRAEAFAACREVIEEIKKRVPVWKKEHYADGTESWLEGCKLAASH